MIFSIFYPVFLTISLSGSQTTAIYTSEYDSKNLTTAEVLEIMFTNYSDRVRPDVDRGTPTNIQFNVYINTISSINEISMDFTLNVYLRQWWKDHRLTFNSRYGQISLNPKDFHKLWIPDVFFPDEKKAERHLMTVPNLLVFLEPDGSVYFSQRLTLVIKCDLALNYFPFDSQTCSITIETYGSKTSELLFAWKGIPPVETANITLPEFEMDKNIPTFNCTKAYISGVYPCLSFKLKFSRMIGYFLIQNYVPSVLIVILSWVSFWIDIKAVPARISLGLLTVLTMTTQTSGIHSRLPRVSYVKAIDVWLTSCMVFVFAALVEFSVVNVLARQDEKKRLATQTKEKDKDISSLRNIVEEVVRMGNGRRTNGSVHPNQLAPGDTCDSNTLPLPLPVIPDRPRVSWTRRIFKGEDGGLALLADKVSRVIFPLIFVLFNVTYWSVYMMIRNTPI